MKSPILLLLFFAFTASLDAQVRSIADSCISFGRLGVDVGPAVPGGDLRQRFGNSVSIGASGGYKFASNFYVEGGMRFWFGGVVKEKVADNIVNFYGDAVHGYYGSATGSDGRQSDVRFQQRGILIPVVAGKILPVFKKLNPNSGLYVEAGGQYIQHRIWIEIPASNVPALQKSLRKGYDRMSDGFGFVEGFGFRMHSNKRLVNFQIGAELSQNFTSPRRSYNYDTGTSDSGIRKDFLWGIKFSWIVPIYPAAGNKEYFY